MQLQGKTILVAGGRDDERAALAAALAAEGADVLLLEASASAASAAGIAWDGDDPEALAAALLADGRAIDAAVTLPARGPAAAFDALEPADFYRGLATGPSGAFLVSRALAPHFVGRGGGAFVHVIPAEGLLGAPGSGLDAVTGTAAMGLSRGTALDLASAGIRSNCLVHAGGAAGLATLSALAAFLCGDAAAGFNGQVLVADGRDLHLAGQPRPIRIAHRDGGWDAGSLAEAVGRRWAGAFVPAGETIHDTIGKPGA